MVDPDMQALILDNGEGMSKCGFSGDDAPRAVFPTIVGRPKNPGIMVGMDAKDCFVGDEAQAKRGILKLKHPIESGCYTNFNDIEKIWHLCVTPEEHPVCISEYPNFPKNNREKITQIFFETFNVPAYYVNLQEVFSLYSSGRTTGCVSDFGEGKISCVTIYEGQHFRDVANFVPIGGKQLTNYFVHYLTTRGYEMTTSAEREIVRDIKEKLCFCSLDYEKELEKAKSFGHCEHEYELPDGNKMSVCEGRFKVPELLFNQDLMRQNKEVITELDKGLQPVNEMIVETIKKSPEELKSQFFDCIVVSGGSSMFPCFEERIFDEIKRIVDPKVKVQVFAAAERKFGAWIGASILTSLSTFVDQWITKDEYDDIGPTVVHKKCL